MGSSQSTPKITAQDRAILDLKLQRDKLRQYQKKIQVVLDQEHEIAKSQLLAGNKDRALIALRRRKYQQGLMLKTDTQLESLEQLVSTIEFSLVEASVLHGLKQGNEVLKEIHKEMSIENVGKLLEETSEAQAYQREISDMLANTLSLDEEDAVQAELAELQAQAKLGERQAQGEEASGEVVNLPSVPSTTPAVEQKQEASGERRKERVPVSA